MAERATEFLINLSANPRALAAFKADPQAAVAKADLSSAEQALILSGDPALIQQALARDPGLADAARSIATAAGDGGTTVVVVVVVVV